MIIHTTNLFLLLATMLQLAAASRARARSTAVAATARGSFAGLPIESRLLAGVRATGALSPLPIQMAATRRVFLGESVALHSQTGSGKTLAYMVPLLARLKRETPLQVLVFVPSRELALQTIEFAQVLRPASAALLNGTKPAVLEEALLRERAPVVVGTSGQLAALNQLLAPPDEAFLTELRRTLRVVVLDESDAILSPGGGRRNGMLNRARRNRALSAMPEALALRRLVERRKDATHRRVQLVIASATLSRRALRDLSTVVGRAAGKVGLVTPAMAPTHGDYSSVGDAGEDWEASVASLQAAEEAAAAAEEHRGDGAGHADHADDEYDEHDEYDDEHDEYDDEHGEGTPPRTAGGASPRTGYGVRNGVRPVGVPSLISHEVVVCREGRKGGIIRGLLEEEEVEAGTSLLVVRDELSIADVIDELQTSGVHDDVIDLRALGTAAARYHAAAQPGAIASLLPLGSGDDGVDREGAALLPTWASSASADARAVGRGGGSQYEGNEASTGVETGPELRRRLRGEALDDASRRAPATPSAAEAEALALEAAASSAGEHALRDGSARWRLIVAHESSVRGLDLPQLQMVILTMIPSTVESYIHIAGRTGRAGARGRAVSVYTRREHDQAGMITRALHDVRWRVRHDDGVQ
jgi:Lhr-like helicase